MVELVTGAIGVLTALAIIILIRKDRLHVHHGLWWMSVAIAFALLGFFPAVFDYLAARVGVNYPPVLALTLALALLVLKILQMDIERSENAAKLTRLVQRIALLEAEMNQQSGSDDAREEAESRPTD